MPKLYQCTHCVLPLVYGGPGSSFCPSCGETHIEPPSISLDELWSRGRYKGKKMSIGRLCKLDPSYAHWLVRSGQLAATPEVCAAIQEGYNHEAQRKTQEHGARRAGRNLFVWNTFTPEKGPDPTHF